jgi:hypothetical protein
VVLQQQQDQEILLQQVHRKEIQGELQVLVLEKLVEEELVKPVKLLQGAMEQMEEMVLQIQ